MQQDSMHSIQPLPSLQENFMVTVDGRLVHVDFGYALGKEPLDSVLIHFAVQGFQPLIGW